MENIKAKAEEIISVRRKELERRRREQLCLLVLNLFADIAIMVKTITINITNGSLAICASAFGGYTYKYPQDIQKMPSSLKESMAEISKIVVNDKSLEWVIKVLKEELGEYISIQRNADKTITSISINDGMSETAKVQKNQQVFQNAGVAPQKQYIETSIEEVEVQKQIQVPLEVAVATYDKAVVSEKEEMANQQSLITKEDTQKQNVGLEVPVFESPIVADEASKADEPDKAQFDDNDPYAVYNWGKEGASTDN